MSENLDTILVTAPGFHESKHPETFTVTVDDQDADQYLMVSQVIEALDGLGVLSEDSCERSGLRLVLARPVGLRFEYVSQSRRMGGPLEYWQTTLLTEQGERRVIGSLASQLYGYNDRLTGKRPF